MKKLIPFLLLIFVAPLSAQMFSGGAGNLSLAVEPRLGVTYGAVGEYLYMQKSDGTWKKNSYLEWEEKTLVTAGLGIFGGYKGVSLKVYGDIAFPLRCGDMYDSDWKLDARPDVKTNYSVHENTATLNVTTGVVLSYDVTPAERVIISPAAEASYAYKSFEARNGYGWYGDTVAWDDPAAHYYPDGKYILGAIDYQCHLFQVFAGLQATFLLTERLSLQAGAFVLPYAYTYVEDCHYTNKKRTEGRYYVDIVHTHFTRYKGFVSCAYQLNQWLALGITVTGLAGDTEKGSLYDEAPDTKKIYRSKGYQSGFSLSALSVSLSANIRIF